VVGNVIPKSDMLVEYSATDLSLKGDYTVAIPKGITRLRLSGSGARFVHGGASLQENVIPVVTVDVTQQSKAHTPHTVDVQGYAEGRLVITGATVSVTVFQCEACGETVLPATVKVGVYSKGGALVSSGEAMLELSSVSENVEERKTRVTLRLTDDVDEYPAVDVRIASRIGNTNKYQTVWEQEYSVNRAFGADF
jgi:ribosomal protein L32